jgi:hypothetical protein
MKSSHQSSPISGQPSAIEPVSNDTHDSELTTDNCF